MQLSSLGYGINQIDGQRLAYIIKWQASYFAVSKSDARAYGISENIYRFNEPSVGSEKREMYDDLLKKSIPPIEMHEFFELSSFENECKTTCGVVTKNGIVNITKDNGVLTFNKSPR